MKNLKKLISVIIAVIMLVGSFATVSAADYKDVESTNSYAKAIQVLSGLGIAKGDDEGNFNPKNDVKRSEMVTFICRAMGEEDVAAGSATSLFTDVAANHWAAGYIAWGVNRGIINGMGDGTFAPDASVSYQDAVVMIMRALGYDRIAQRKENGGYPVGYLKLASQYGVLKDAGYNNTAAATREIIAQLIFNGLTAAMVDVTEYGDTVEGDKYKIYNGKNGNALKNLLTDVNDIYRVKIEIDATPKTDATDCVDKNGNEMVRVNLDDACDNYTISEIASKLGFVGNTWDDDGDDADGNGFKDDGTNDNASVTATPEVFDGTYSTKLYVGETDVANYLGYTFEAYIAEDDDLNGNVILAAVVEEKAIVTETITTGLADATFSANVYSYMANETDSKATEIKVAPGAQLYYNGTELSNISAIPSVGGNTTQHALRVADSITFMGNKNAAYNKIFITDYNYKRVKSVNVEEEFIKFDGNGALELHEDVRGEDFIYNLYDANGKAIALEDIKKDDILNIVAPIDVTHGYDIDKCDFVDIYVTSNAVTGKVAETIDGGKYVVIDDETYGNACGVTARDEGIFFISIDGKIVDREASAIVSKNFAFLMGVEEDTSFKAKSYTVRIFTAEGKEIDVPVADIVTIYNSTAGAEKIARATNTTGVESLNYYFDKDVGILKLLTDDDTTSAASAQANVDDRFFSYKTNADGELIEMRFAANNSAIVSEHKALGRYDADFNEFEGESVEDAILFAAPVSKVVTACPGGCTEDHNGAEAGNGTCLVDKWNVKADDLAIGNFATLDESSTYDSYLYTFEDEKDPAVVLFSVPATPGLKFTSLAVVQAVGTTLNADGTSVANYTFIQSGEVVKAMVDYNKYGPAFKYNGSEELEPGDVVQYAVNAAGEITQMAVIYDQDAHAIVTNYDLDTENAAIVFGVVTEFDEKLVLADTVEKLLLDDGVTRSSTEIEATAGQTAQFKVNETEASTYAFYNETLAKNKVSKISINGIKATRRHDVVYAAIARLNGKANGKAEDIVLVSIALPEANTIDQNVSAINGLSFDINPEDN